MSAELNEKEIAIILTLVRYMRDDKLAGGATQVRFIYDQQLQMLRQSLNPPAPPAP